MRKEIYANALIVPATRRGDANGHLGLVMPNAQYFIRAGEPYLASAAPGIQVPHAANATNIIIIEANQQFDKDSKEYSTHATVKAALRATQSSTSCRTSDILSGTGGRRIWLCGCFAANHSRSPDIKPFSRT
jgi:hypothetical protein